MKSLEFVLNIIFFVLKIFQKIFVRYKKNKKCELQNSSTLLRKSLGLFFINFSKIFREYITTGNPSYKKA